MSTPTNEEFQAAKIGIEVIIRHVSHHADFRGQIMRLDKNAQFARITFQMSLPSSDLIFGALYFASIDRFYTEIK
jgi:hypothetical protein